MRYVSFSMHIVCFGDCAGREVRQGLFYAQTRDVKQTANIVQKNDFLVFVAVFAVDGSGLVAVVRFVITNVVVVWPPSRLLVMTPVK